MDGFIKVKRTEFTPKKLGRILKDKGVILQLFIDTNEKNISIVSYADTAYGIARYAPKHYLEKNNTVSDSTDTVISKAEWDICFNDNEHYINIASESYEYIDISLSELEKRLYSSCKKGNDCELYISYDIGNFYGPLEIDLAAAWLKENPDYHLGVFSREVEIFTVTDGGQVTSINDKSIKEIVFPSFVKSFGYKLLRGSQAERIVIPRHIKHIDGCAFAESECLREVALSEGLSSIGHFAFSECPLLSEIILPSSLKSVGEYAFSECTSLKSIEIPEKITKIPRACFSLCTSLEEISIPEGLKEIGKNAFYSCTSLKHININADIKIEKDAFALCEKQLYKKAAQITLLRKYSEYASKKAAVIKDIIPAHSVYCPDETDTLKKGMIPFDGRDKKNLPKYLFIPEEINLIEAGSIPPSIESIFISPSVTPLKTEQSILYTNLPLRFVFHFGRSIDLKNTFRPYSEKTVFVSFAEDSVTVNGERLTEGDSFIVLHIKKKDDLREFILRYGDKIHIETKEKLFGFLRATSVIRTRPKA